MKDYIVFYDDNYCYDQTYVVCDCTDVKEAIIQYAGYMHDTANGNREFELFKKASDNLNIKEMIDLYYSIFREDKIKEIYILGEKVL